MASHRVIKGYNHKEGEAQIAEWAKDYGYMKENQAPTEELESLANKIINETRLCIKSREEEQELMGHVNGDEAYDSHETRIQVLEANIASWQAELYSLRISAGMGNGDSVDSGPPSQSPVENAAQHPSPLPNKPNVPFPGGFVAPLPNTTPSSSAQTYPASEGNSRSSFPQPAPQVSTPQGGLGSRSGPQVPRSQGSSRPQGGPRIPGPQTLRRRTTAAMKPRAPR